MLLKFSPWRVRLSPIACSSRAGNPAEYDGIAGAIACYSASPVYSAASFTGSVKSLDACETVLIDLYASHMAVSGRFDPDGAQRRIYACHSKTFAMRDIAFENAGGNGRGVEQ